MNGNALLDTNILTALRDAQHSRHAVMNETIDSMRHEQTLHVAPQVIYEFWTVATRPKEVNGLGWTTEEAGIDIASFRQAFTLLPDPPNLLDEWLELCRSHEVSGKNAHDARLAAYARLNNIKTLVTLNPRDFARYGFTVMVP